MNKVEKIISAMQQAISNLVDLKKKYGSGVRGDNFAWQERQYTDKIKYYKDRLKVVGKGELAKITVKAQVQQSNLFEKVYRDKTFFLVGLNEQEIVQLVNIHYVGNLGYEIQFLETGIPGK